MDEYLYLLGKLAPTCATCTNWRPIKATDYRGACAIGAVYGAPAHDDRCDQHSALAKMAVDQQSMARGDMASAWGVKKP